MAIWLALLLAGCAGKLGGQPLEGVVVGVADGDTITLLDSGRQQHKIRFAYIDAPEKAQPFGQAARKHLADKLFQQQVRVDVVERDRYGRTVGRVWLGEQDVNLSQVADGFAWHYQYYARKTQPSDEFDRYANAEQQARSQQTGLWQDHAPVSPWQFRRGKNTHSGGYQPALTEAPGLPGGH